MSDPAVSVVEPTIVMLDTQQLSKLGTIILSIAKMLKLSQIVAENLGNPGDSGVKHLNILGIRNDTAFFYPPPFRPSKAFPKELLEH